ncbi:hypothetical protein AB9T88_11355 [Flavobacterium sp. LBUM151]
MKLTITFMLLIFIAISMQIYLLNNENYSETTVALAVPITINALLIIIYLCHPEDSEYTIGLEKIFIYSVIISAIYCAVFLYGMQLGKAYKN